MSCPDCERYKASASRWRAEAYRLGGTPLPWSPDARLLAAALELIEDVDRTGDTQVLAYAAPPVVDAIRARLKELE